MKESAFVTNITKTLDEERKASVMHILEKLQAVHYEKGAMILKSAYDGYGNEEAAKDIDDIYVVRL